MDQERVDKQRILGRTHGDHEKLFPRKTNAYAAVTSEVEVNGTVLKIWEFAQLETLSRIVLKQRMMTIRDAVGEANCPPLPSGHNSEMIRWILHMQSEIASQQFEVGHPKPGSKGVVPSAFLHESRERPITHEGPVSPTLVSAPFGPRTAHVDFNAKRDNYRNLKEEKHEFADAEPHINLGIQSMRLGGEGRRHINPEGNMVHVGVSAAGNQGIQSLKEGGEGRRYIECKDSVAQHKREMDAEHRGLVLPQQPPPRSSADPQRHVSHTHMDGVGVAAPLVEPHIGGERRRRAKPQENMVTTGTSNAVDDPKTYGRRHLDSFGGGGKGGYGDAHNSYQTTWKKDPSRLQGTSLLI